VINVSNNLLFSVTDETLLTLTASLRAGTACSYCNVSVNTPTRLQYLVFAMQL
jgi:hypothetical protein